MSWNADTSWNTDEDLINVSKDTNDSGVEALKDKKYEKFIEKSYQVIKHIQEIGLPKNNEQIRLVTFRSFNAVLFVKYIAEKEIIEDMSMVVYSFNHEACKMLMDLLNSGRINHITILMSNLRNKAHRKKEQLTRDMLVDNPNVDLFFASAHSKIISMKTESGNYYSLEGSGNLSFNSRIEQYILDNDKKLYNFTKDWMEEIKVYLRGKKELVLT